MVSSVSGIIDVGTVSIGYERAGDGPSIVCIGGMDMDFPMWRRTYLDTLNGGGYSTVTVALRGIPPSASPPPPYSVEELTNDCAVALSRLDVAPYFLFGVSLGALVAQELALARSKDVRRLALVGTTLRQTAWAKMSTQGEVDFYASDAALPLDYVVATDILQGFSPDELSDDELVNRIALGMKRKDHRSPERRGLLSAVANYPGCEDRIDRLAMPTLIVSFEGDVLTSAKITRDLCRRSENITFVQIASSGHAGIFTRRREVAKEVLSFFGASKRELVAATA